jgi:hypothetical protein
MTPQPAAYAAPSGKAVYFGDYVYVGNGVVQMRYNLGAAQAAVHGTVFLCTP